MCIAIQEGLRLRLGQGGVVQQVGRYTHMVSLTHGQQVGRYMSDCRLM